MGGGGGGSDTAVVESCSCSSTASQANATELQDGTIKAVVRIEEHHEELV
jgi:hypothetical protein